MKTKLQDWKQELKNIRRIRSSSKDDIRIPTDTIKKIPKFKFNDMSINPGLVGTAINEFHNVFEYLLNSHDKPAFYAIIAICAKLHENRQK